MTVSAYDVNNRPEELVERGPTVDELEAMVALNLYVLGRLYRIEAAFTTKQRSTKAYLELTHTIEIMRGRLQRYRSDIMRVRTAED